MHARRFIVGVMGSGEREYAALSEQLGHYLGRLPVHLLVGGGGGVMSAVACAYKQAARDGGCVIGILPSIETGSCELPEGYPNPWIDIPIRTHLGARGRRGGQIDSRNHINVLTANAVVALPGGLGTLSEVLLCLRYERPVIVFQGDEPAFPELPAQVMQTSEISDVAEFLCAAGLDPTVAD